MFWMVYGEGQRAPTYKHDTEESAKREAERLAVAHGGQYHVLALVASVKRNDVIWTDPNYNQFRTTDIGR